MFDSMSKMSRLSSEQGEKIPEVRASAPRNRTIRLTEEETERLSEKICPMPCRKVSADEVSDCVIMGDMLAVMEFLPDSFADAVFLDPPYNLTKDFNGNVFRKRGDGAYFEYLMSWLPKIVRLMKENAAVYLCCDWKCTAACYEALRECGLNVRNRITWQREKGRSADDNWKNACEDIWYAVKGDEPIFHGDAVRMKRKVIAPYRTDGVPKDWNEEGNGRYRLTGASNFWDDLTVPFWSMRENTDHPTQKPEKLLAKLLLASTEAGGVVFDPFGGSGTTAVTARKLGRKFTSIEQSREYCCLTLKRLEMEETDSAIQGYEDGVFWERNSQPPKKQENHSISEDDELFLK